MTTCVQPRGSLLKVGDGRAVPLKAAQKLIDPFVFVPISKSEAARGRGSAKRVVRAHVTRVQHAHSKQFAGVDLQSWTVDPCVPKESITSRRKPRRPPIKSIAAVDKACSSSGSSVGSEELLPTIPRMVDNGVEDPFWTIGVDYKPEIAPILAHYIQNIAVDIPDLDGPHEKGLLRRSLFPMCMTEAAAMYAILLMGASHYCVVNPTKGKLIDLLALKARALNEINASLADPEKAVTDAMIMAVAKLAAYESIFGDTTVFAAHMRGLQQMVKLRGGLSTLGLNGLLERMVVWIDLNACHLTGMAAHLGTEDLPTTVHFDGPDPFHFAGIS